MRSALILTLFAAFISTLQPPVAAQPVPVKEGFTEFSTLIVRIVKPAKMIGYPAVCPGTSPEDNQEDVICMAELYEARAKVLKNLGGAKTEENLTIRFTAHSAHAFWQRNVRFLLVVYPFEDDGDTGHFAKRWDWEDARGEFCQDSETAAKEEWEPIKRAFASGKKRVAGEGDENWREGTQLVCIPSRETE